MVYVVSVLQMLLQMLLLTTTNKMTLITLAAVLMWRPSLYSAVLASLLVELLVCSGPSFSNLRKISHLGTIFDNIWESTKQT